MNSKSNGMQNNFAYHLMLFHPDYEKSTEKMPAS